MPERFQGPEPIYIATQRYSYSRGHDRANTYREREKEREREPRDATRLDTYPHVTLATFLRMHK